MAGVVLAGCVAPGRVDINLLTRYQDWARSSSPQARAGDEGLNVIQQVVTRPTLPVSIIRDPAKLTARVDRKLSDVTMTLKEALELARQNKLVIEPVGMDRKLPAVQLSLQDAIRLALMNSLDIRVVSFDTAIAYTDMVAAASAFDVEVFGSAFYEHIKKRTSSRLQGMKIRKVLVEAGARQRTVIGTDIETKLNFTRTADNSPVIDIDPSYEWVLSLELTQPLLRLGGPDVNLGELRISRVAHDVSLAAFREQVEKTVTEVINNYWLLVQAREDADIQQRLLIITIQTHDRVLKRRQLDATDVEVKQAESALLARWSGMVRARKQIFDVQDRLARLLADPRMPVSSRYEILPTDAATESRILFDATEQIELAIQNNPTLEQAYLAIKAADISVRVARNLTLPVLNAVASVNIQGLRGNPSRAWDDMWTTDFLSHTSGLVFEYPLGNRGPEAEYSKRRFEKLQAVTTYHNAADQVAVAVNEAIRQIDTTYEEFLAQRRAREAKAIQLRALEDTERIRARLTPEFLQLKLATQEQLAASARLELFAIIGYNNALAELTRLTGTLLVQQGVEVAAEAAISGRPAPAPVPAPMPRAAPR
jgi:outer membrane protein TolC